MILKKTGLCYTFLQATFLVTLVVNLYAFDEISATATYWLIAQLALNLILPIIIYFIMVREEEVQRWVGRPSKIERHLTTLGKDIEFKDITDKGDTWLFAISIGIVLGVSRMVLANSDSLSLNVGQT